MTSLTPDERSLRSRMAAHKSWGVTPDRTARTQPGRDAAFARFEREADPDGTLDPAERRRRAKNLQQAHMLSLSIKAAEARKARRVK